MGRRDGGERDFVREPSDDWQSVGPTITTTRRSGRYYRAQSSRGSPG